MTMKSIETNVELSLDEWLRALSKLLPAKKVALIGAGDGSGEWCSYVANMPPIHTVLVEADEEKFNSLEARFDSVDGMSLCSALMGQAATGVEFYSASYSDESGILVPEDLCELWPNLRTERRRQLQATTLDQIPELEATDWLFIDCLPAHDILCGGATMMQKVNVVLARVLLTDEGLIDGDPSVWARGGITSVSEMLGRKGFELLTVREGRHPHIGHALFGREASKGSTEDGSAGSAGSDEYIDGDKLEQLDSRISELERSKVEKQDLDQMERTIVLHEEKVKASFEARISEIEERIASVLGAVETRISELKRRFDEQQKTIEDAFGSFKVECEKKMRDSLSIIEGVEKQSEERVHKLSNEISKVQDSCYKQSKEEVQRLEKAVLHIEESCTKKHASEIVNLQKKIASLEEIKAKQPELDAADAKRRLAAIEDAQAKQHKRHVAAKQEISKAVSQIDLLKEIFMQESGRR